MNNNDPKQVKEPESVKKPNEVGGFYFMSGIKIYDPNTKEVLVQQRDS